MVYFIEKNVWFIVFLNIISILAHESYAPHPKKPTYETVSFNAFCIFLFFIILLS